MKPMVNIIIFFPNYASIYSKSDGKIYITNIAIFDQPLIFRLLTVIQPITEKNILLIRFSIIRHKLLIQTNCITRLQK